MISLPERLLLQSNKFCKQVSQPIVNMSLMNSVRTVFRIQTRSFTVTRRCRCEKGTVDRPLFPGSRSSWTEKLEFLGSETYEGIPVYRVTDRDGKVIDPSQDPQLGQEKITKMYKG